MAAVYKLSLTLRTREVFFTCLLLVRAHRWLRLGFFIFLCGTHLHVWGEMKSPNSRRENIVLTHFGFRVRLILFTLWVFFVSSLLCWVCVFSSECLPCVHQNSPEKSICLSISGRTSWMWFSLWGFFEVFHLLSIEWIFFYLIWPRSIFELNLICIFIRYSSLKFSTFVKFNLQLGYVVC